MDYIDKLDCLIDLVDEHCHIDHGGWTDNKECKAVDMLVIPVTEGKLTIPVCKDCAETLWKSDAS